MKSIALLMSALMLSLAIHSQNITVSGHITDRNSGETLINASVFNTITGKGSVSNVYGFYSLTIPKGEVKLRYSYVGFAPENLNLILKKDTVINIKLNTSTELGEITVFSGANREAGVKGSQMSTVEITADKIKTIPTLFGETDVIKALQLLPGVQAGTEGSAGLYVRGGGPDENLLLLDGIPVYNVNHMFGFFSVFNTDAIKNVTLYKGNFPARFGGRLSSVVDIRTNDGNDKKIHGNVSIGLISSKFNLEGPIIKEKTTFNVSLRRTYADIISQPLIWLASRQDGSITGASAGYYFYDFNAKISHKISDKDHLYLSFYSGDDVIYARYNDKNITGNNYTQTSKIKLDWNWGNVIFALRWNHIINSKLFLNTTASYTRYRFDMGVGTFLEEKVISPPQTQSTDIELGYKSGIEDISMKADFDYTPSPNHDIKFGLNYIYHTFRPGVTVAKYSVSTEEKYNLDTTIGDDNIFSHETMLYVEDNFNLGPFIKINAGLHYSTFFVQDEFYNSLQPRLSMRFLINDRFSAKAGFAAMNQYIHLLSNSSISLPTDLWVPVTKRITPMKSNQYSAGLFYNLNDKIDFSLEGYYKSMDNLIEYKDGATFMGSNTGWEDKVCMGRGWAYGIELLAQKSYGRTTGWIGYTWSKSERLFDRPGQELNNGEAFPAKYDRRHDVSLTVTHKFNDKIDLSGTWVYSTGNCGTLAMQYYEGQSIPQSNQYSNTASLASISHRNNYRFNPYHRMDIGVNFHKKKKQGIRTWNISIYNAYNQLNPFMVYPDYSSEYNSSTGKYIEKKTLKQVSLFPLIPSISYSYKF
jgi:outer membrane cobalamin receptor